MPAFCGMLDDSQEKEVRERAALIFEKAIQFDSKQVEEMKKRATDAKKELDALAEKLDKQKAAVEEYKTLVADVEEGEPAPPSAKVHQTLPSLESNLEALKQEHELAKRHYECKKNLAEPQDDCPVSCGMPSLFGLESARMKRAATKYEVIQALCLDASLPEAERTKWHLTQWEAAAPEGEAKEAEIQVKKRLEQGNSPTECLRILIRNSNNNEA